MDYADMPPYMIISRLLAWKAYLMNTPEPSHWQSYKFNIPHDGSIHPPISPLKPAGIMLLLSIMYIFYQQAV